MGGTESRFARLVAWRMMGMMGAPAGSKPIPPVSRLSHNVIRVLGCNPGPMTLQGTNTYVLGTGVERLLVDAGEKGNSSYIKSLKDVLAEEKAKISKIILTHWHADHTGGLDGVLASGCTTDRPQLLKYKLAEEERYEHFGNDSKVAVEGATVRALHTPGHTTDHLSLLLEENNAVFSGDCILGEGSSVFEHYANYLKSLKLLAEMDPAVMYPAHGSVIENPVPVIQQYIAHREQREKEIIAELQRQFPGESTADKLVSAIYPTLNFILRKGALNNVVHHLNKLIEEGKVEMLHGDRFRLIHSNSTV
ncbi:hypothetical protein RvY_14692-2 [Ramazzottius varieornatus]|uniref:Beta-lactamase-like protein 2 homolog n=1 Tax=Ramazzottius varieornatus TaxID=947166 RepID=A0A1D1VSB4_RAMVA|nr:hypothetical protein RvY_14692-2 [Ramazzottius varieornatus]